ncbi:hypothetical protein [Taibaiella soli]|uniref:Uncharacterized protein n=1 Tax=Taibaiella soli TaxID=1649169 RepID=A0A2W2AHR2_9BACT|nr:hypothetical protein [Taibaiella soli]PZF74811.1 hypothetical protein DN068_01030 [Taibaiella soli]
MRHVLTCLVTLFIALMFASAARAQEEATGVYYSKRYLDLNICSLSKYHKRLERQQIMLLHQLKKEEAKLQRKLKRADSAAYARLQNQPFTYDSISKLSRVDSSALITKISQRRDAAIDSLQGVLGFMQDKSALLSEGAVNSSQYSSELQSLQQKINYRNYLNELITQRINNLKSIVGKNDLSVFNALQKNILVAKSKMQIWKQVADDPSKAEEKALEYLQGFDGFDKTLSQSTSVGSMQSGMNASDLEKMGMQTKDQLSKALQQKFGNNIGQVQNMMGSQVAEWQNKAHDVTNKVKETKQQIADAQSGLTKVKPDLIHPAIKLKNPMRGLPFWKRLEKSYNYATSRATPAGQPAMLQAAGMIGYKQTPKVSYGIGTALNVGMGQDWNHIKFTFEGIGLRSYVQAQLVFGIALYGGYERTYRQAAFTGPRTISPQETSLTPNNHNTAKYYESVLLGIAKTYKMNSKWNGQIQVLYDVWWRDKGLNSPVVLRFATSSK